MARIDGKYEVIEEHPQGGGRILYTVQAVPKPGEQAGERLKLSWFEVNTPAERSTFHRYRAALKALAPAGLSDVVTRPGAYYAVWRPVSGQPLALFYAQNVKNEAAINNLSALGQQLASQGYALEDAELVMDGDTPKIAYLSAAQRPLAEAQALNAATLAPLAQGRVRRSRPPISVWSWLPGLALMAGAVYLGVQATQIYLNPPINDVPLVVGQSGTKAAQALTQRGFRVQYIEGDSREAVLGAVINQEPSAGSNLHLGRLITLTVNNPPALKVPRLENMSVQQAKAVLSENRLKLGNVSPVDGTLTGVPKGKIVAQLPPPDSRIRRGQAVQLLVSSGVSVRQTWLPDLRGLSFEDARALVKRAGMVVHTVRREGSEKAEGTVLRQNPAPYVKADVGTPVTVVVAKAQYQPPAQAVTPLPVPPPPPPPPPPVEAPANPDLQIQDPAVQPPSTPPAEQQGSSDTQIVPMIYTFPADIGPGKVEILVRDDDGERSLLPPTDTASLAGATAQRDDVQVRGNYVFIVRLDGKDYATFGP